MTLCDTISRKTLFYLISTLNAAFSDYDFSDAKSSEFSKEPSLSHVTSNIDSLWSVTATEQYAKVHDSLWVTLNEEIGLQDCDIYSYNPDLASDPFGEDGCLWEVECSAVRGQTGSREKEDFVGLWRHSLVFTV